MKTAKAIFESLGQNIQICSSYIVTPVVIFFLYVWINIGRNTRLPTLPTYVSFNNVYPLRSGVDSWLWLLSYNIHTFLWVLSYCCRCSPRISELNMSHTVNNYQTRQLPVYTETWIVLGNLDISWKLGYYSETWSLIGSLRFSRKLAVYRKLGV